MSPNYPDGGMIGLFLAAAFFWFIFAIGFYVLSSLFLMKIFEKAGVQGQWRAWVPVYNFMVFSKLGDLSPWLILYAVGATILLSWIPVIGWIIGLAPLLVTLLAAWRVGLKLQKEAVWVILYFFLSIVWLGINAYDKSRWNTVVPAAPWAGNAFLADRTVWQGVPSQVPAGGYPANPVTQPGYPAPGAYPPPPGAYPPPAGAQPPAAPPQGYAPAPPGYQPPAPEGYAPPPAGYQPPPATPPAAAPGYAAPPPAAAPGSSAPPPAATPPTPSADYQASTAGVAGAAAAETADAAAAAAEDTTEAAAAVEETTEAAAPAIDFGDTEPPAASPEGDDKA